MRLSAAFVASAAIFLAVVADTSMPSMHCSSPNDSSEGGGTCEALSQAKTNSKCGLYIAPSSIPDADIGVYSAEFHPKGSLVGPNGICHVIVDMHHGTVINDYEWDAGSMGTAFEGQYVVNICPGVAMLANGHFDLCNIQLGMPNFSDGGLHRSKSPGAGAITPFHNLTAKATKPIPAGSELFLNYGSDYFSDRPHKYDGGVPLSQDFAAADRIVKQLGTFSAEHGDELTKAMEGRVLDLVQGILSDVPEMSMAAKILPSTFDEIRSAAAVGTARLQLPDSIRSLEWLETNGWCVDNLGPGKSTKPEAGWGAFATRPISEGGIVTASPLLHLFKDQVIYFTREDSSGNISSMNNVRKQQLLNYCFGHPQSSIVLYPYAPIVNLINHDSDQPNVIVRWAADDKQPQWWKDGRRGDVLTKDLRRYGGSGSVLEFVATRNIHPGDEIFLDYGRDWEEEWKKHLDNWSAPQGSETFTDASSLNNGSNEIVRTIKEQLDDPYPPNIQTACFVEYYRSYADLEDVGGDEGEVVEVELDWEESEHIYTGHHYLRPCIVMERRTDALYTAELLNRPHGDEEEMVKDFEKVIVSGIPRRAILFVNRLYTTDQHIESAFRHPIGMPDSLFPLEWKDLANS